MDTAIELNTSKIDNPKPAILIQDKYRVLKQDVQKTQRMLQFGAKIGVFTPSPNFYGSLLKYLSKSHAKRIGYSEASAEECQARQFVRNLRQGIYRMSVNDTPENLRSQVMEARSPQALERLVPSTKKYQGSWIGVEIECCHSPELSSGELPELLGVSYASDSSVTTSPGYSNAQFAEIRIFSKNVESLGRTIDILNKQLDLRVNASCGLHVHLDLRGKARYTYSRKLRASLPLLCRIVSPSRLTNTYCAVNPYPESRGTTQFDQDQIRQVRWVGSFRRRAARYRALNMGSFGRHGTLEVRLHQGTVDREKIVNWVRLLQWIVSQPLRKEGYNLKGFLDDHKAPLDLQRYVYARACLFAQTPENKIAIAAAADKFLQRCHYPSN